MMFWLFTVNGVKTMSIRAKLSPWEIASLYSTANLAVWHSHRDAHRLRGATQKLPVIREEEYVATLVTRGVAMLAARWQAILSPKNIRLQIAGVFCHGHPQVKFNNNSKAVELADLLIVHRHVPSKGKEVARALLVQAKKSSKMTCNLEHNDLQLDLFTNWPDFQFVTGGLSSGFRAIKEKGKGSRYALIYSQPAWPEEIFWAGLCPWAACPAKRLLSANQSFGKLLGDILLGKDGRRVGLRSPRSDWSRTITELLQVTGQRTYTRKAINYQKVSRMHTAPTGVLFLAQINTSLNSTYSQDTVVDTFFSKASSVKSLQGDNPPSEPISHNGEVRGSGGQSAIIIETAETD